MPKYTRRRKYAEGTKPHSLLLLHHATPVVWDQIKSLAANFPQEEAAELGIHPDAFLDVASEPRTKLIPALHEEPVGGGLGSALKRLFKKLWDQNPVSSTIRKFKALHNAIKNYQLAYSHGNSISDHTRQIAQLLQESYKSEKDRKTEFQGYTRIPDQNEYIDVWENQETKSIKITVRGSQSAKDWLLDDTAIALTGEPISKITQELAELVKKYNKGNRIELAGHSLGSSLIGAAIAQDSSILAGVDQVDLFNPGVSLKKGGSGSVSKLAHEDKVTFFMNLGDPASIGLLGTHPDHAVIQKPSWNPVKNHSLSQWVAHSGPFEHVQIGEEKGGIELKYPGIIDEP